MNEHVGESGANCRKTEQEKTCKNQEDKNAVQGDLLVRRRQVYPKKPRYNLLTPDQLKDKKKARVASENSLTQAYPKKPRYNLLTPDQLKDKKKAATVRRKEKRVAFENSLTPDQLKELEDKKNAATVQRKEKRVAFENSLTPDELGCNTE